MVRMLMNPETMQKLGLLLRNKSEGTREAIGAGNKKRVEKHTDYKQSGSSHSQLSKHSIAKTNE